MTDPTEQPTALFISYYFPPNLSIGALRPWHLANEFAERGFRAVVVRSNLGGQGDGPPIKADVRTVRTIDSRTAAEARRHRAAGRGRRISGGDRRGRAKPVQPTAAPRSAPPLEASRVRRLLDLFPASVLVGEGGPVYFVAALRQALRAPKPDVVVSSSSPMVDHLVARIVRRRRGAQWVADFRDPLRDASTSTRRLARIQSWMTWKCIGVPDVVTSVSEGALGSIPVRSDRRIVVSPGLSKIAKRSGEQPSGDEFRVVYTGSLYGERSNPRAVFDALQSLIRTGATGSERLRIVYAGPHGAQMRTHCEASGIDDRLVDLGRVPHAEAIRLQDTADVNLAVTWSFPGSRGVLTGKMFEYFAARRPIVCVINGDRDEEVEQLLDGDPALHLIRTGDEDAVETARRLFGRWLADFAQHGVRPSSVNERTLDRFVWETRTQSLFAALGPIASGR